MRRDESTGRGTDALNGDPVLLTGSTGFLGGHVASALRDAGHPVVAMVRRIGPERRGVRQVEGDLEDPASVKRALEGIGAVVHVAGFVSTAARDRRRVFEVNAIGASNLLDAAAAAGVRRIVFTSSTSAVGALRDNRPEAALAEDAVFDLHALDVPYLQAKRAAHEVALRAREEGAPIVVVSPSFVLGPGDWRLTSSELIDAFVRRRLPGCLAGGLNAVDVRDLARAYVSALEHCDPSPHYILAGAENLNSRAFFERLAHCSGIAAPRFAIPRWAALVAGHCVERVSPGSSLSAASVRLGSLYWYFDASLARRELGFVTRPLDETLRSALDWVRELPSKQVGHAA